MCHIHCDHPSQWRAYFQQLSKVLSINPNPCGGDPGVPTNLWHDVVIIVHHTVTSTVTGRHFYCDEPSHLL
jgi:hypothetical protein